MEKDNRSIEIKSLIFIAQSLGKIVEKTFDIDLTTPQVTDEGECSWFEYIERLSKTDKFKDIENDINHKN